MKLQTLTATALATLFLAACSSGDDPDSTTGNSDSTSGATQAAAGSGDSGGSGDQANAPTDVCDALDRMNDIDQDFTDASGDLDALLGDASAWNDPATVAAIHDAGQLMLDKIPAVTAYYTTAADTADDPDVSAALLALGDLYDVYFRALAQAAVDADSMMDYSMSVATALGDEDVSRTLTNGSAASITLGNYALKHCVN